MITFAKIPKAKTSIVTFGNTEIGPYYWVGNCKNGINYYAGQTFQTPTSGLLKKIKLFPSVLYGTTDATLSIYEFDAITYSWKTKLGETVKRINKSQENEWVEFDLPSIPVNTHSSYGFKLSCTGSGMMAIAECPWNKRNPYEEGMEWVASSNFEEGRFQEDFDFAFEGEIETSLNAQFI